MHNIVSLSLFNFFYEIFTISMLYIVAPSCNHDGGAKKKGD